MSQATRRMLAQRVMRQRDKLYAQFYRREPKYRLMCAGMGPMGVEGWLRFFDCIDAWEEHRETHRHVPGEDNAKVQALQL